jgi:hypothetical protein
MAGGFLATNDFWRVNSYGYPNPFNTDVKSQEAWATFVSFVDHEQVSYRELKQFWASAAAPRKIDSHAVESWKATFEEFGLLYVIGRSDRVIVTPAGHQILAAFKKDDVADFVWIGLNLLFRYPLQGRPGGRRRASDILPYRFLYSAMRDLGDYFWFVELERILCRVFTLSEAKPAVEAIRKLRGNPSELDDFPVPAEKKGAFYNSLNQVANHAGMNHFLLKQDNESEHYATTESRRRHFINRSYLSIVSAALGDALDKSDCAQSALYVDRLPGAPSFADEQAYFDYMGAPVTSIEVLGSGGGPRTIDLAGDKVFLLKAEKHFSSVISVPAYKKLVQGKSLVFCRIARNHRIILSTDVNWTYLVIGKDLVGPDTVELTLRRAKPITSALPIEELFGSDD